MLPTFARVATRALPLSRRVCAQRLMSTVYKASANAAATQPISRSKPVKETGVDIEQYSTGEDISDRTLGESTSKPTSGDQAYANITVADILKKKEKFGTALHTVGENDSVTEAMTLMQNYNVGAILVTGGSQEIVGILSTRDFIKRVVKEDTKVSELMTRELVYTYSDVTALHSINLMNSGGFRHLPVRERGSNKTIGVLSIGDCVRTMLDVFKQKTEYLEDLVSGKYPA